MSETIIYPASLNVNKQKLQHVHDIASLVLGVGSGVLTLESLYGFAFYLVGFTLTNVVFYVVCCEGQPKRFFTNPLQQVFLDGIFGNVSGFIMMWCLVYALVKV